jgi:hypothetical protein
LLSPGRGAVAVATNAVVVAFPQNKLAWGNLVLILFIVAMNAEFVAYVIKLLCPAFLMIPQHSLFDNGAFHHVLACRQARSQNVWVYTPILTLKYRYVFLDPLRV